MFYSLAFGMFGEISWIQPLCFLLQIFMGYELESEKQVPTKMPQFLKSIQGFLVRKQLLKGVANGCPKALFIVFFVDP